MTARPTSASDFWRLLDAACSGGLTPEQRSQLGACLEGSLEAQEDPGRPPLVVRK